MDYFYSIVLAIVQAVTEFLPISSTGHLIIIHYFLPAPLLDSLTFDVMLHAGTLIALIIYFGKDLIKLGKGFFLYLFKRQQPAEFLLASLIIVGILPALIAGYFLENYLEQKFRSVFLVVLTLIIGGILFIVFEKISVKKRDLSSLTIADALIIGLWQVLALIPGVSRSGITMVGGLAVGFSRKEAAKFSFLMAIPLIFLATIRRITQISLSDSSINFIFVCILGVAVAALVGYLVIKYFIKFLEKYSLVGFAIYRFILAAGLVIFFLLNFK